MSDLFGVSSFFCFFDFVVLSSFFGFRFFPLEKKVEENSPLTLGSFGRSLAAKSAKSPSKKTTESPASSAIHCRSPSNC